MANREPTVDIRPLIEWWQGRRKPHDRIRCVCTVGGECGSLESLARRVRVSHSTMHRRSQAGRLGVAEADRWAITLGVHPSAIWPGWSTLKPCYGWRCDE